MRLQQYLLREAKVKQTDADVFLKEYAPTFMWNSEDGLIWAVHKSGFRWEAHQNSKFIGEVRSMSSSLISHPELWGKAKGRTYGTDEDVEIYIRGRISPDGKTIFVHDMKSREHAGMSLKQYKRAVNKTIDAVYRYMKEYIR